MSQPTREQVEAALAGVQDVHLGMDLVAAKAVTRVDIAGADVTVHLTLGYPARGYRDELTAEISRALAELPGVGRVTVDIRWEVVSHGVQKGVTPLPGIKNVIAVASGKGGVGKSTTAVNLALALSVEGASAGVLDADIYGPSQPRMLGIHARPESKDGKSMEPVVSHGIQSMSIGYLIDEETPMIWRGPMVTQALEQLLRETNWHELDYLVVDLPPGTGDIQLTLSQRIPVSGAIIVTTPQDIALLDARKALRMFEKVEILVLGVVENMSTHICSQCGYEEHIFGAGGGHKMAEQYAVEFLGALPLDIHIREDADGGTPSVVKQPEGRIAMAYRAIARRAAARLALAAKDYSAKFPKIVVK